MLYLSLALSPGTYGKSPAEEIERPQETLPRTLIIVGDSIMAGCKASAEQPSPDYSLTTAHLVAQHGVPVVNLSRAGNSMVNAEVQRADGGINFTQTRGAAIWITLGGNDFIWGYSTVEQYRDNYLTVLGRINPVPGQRLFCVTPLISGIDLDNWRNSKNESYEQYRQVVRDIASQGHCTLVDTSQWFSKEDIYDECTMPDRVHLGEQGHKRYAERMLEVLRREYAN